MTLEQLSDYRDGRYLVLSRIQFREVLIRVDPSALDCALQNWNAQYAEADEGLAIDGRTMCNAIDGEGRQTHISAPSGIRPSVATPKKVAVLPVDGSDEIKQTNEIGMAIPLLEELDLASKTITADALLTQRKLTTSLNQYLDFPFVGQAFALERTSINKKTGKESIETVYGLTSHTPLSADPDRVLAFNRDHWRVESHHDILDWNWDEDRLHATHRTRSGKYHSPCQAQSRP